MVKISIIVVCLNPGNKLIETLETVFMQTYQNFEIIIKDGLSNDGSIEQVENAFNDDRVFVYREKDTGIYDAMNQAVAKATGDYVFYLNCGDQFHDKDILQKVANKISEYNREEKLIIYGNIYGVKNQVSITSSPKITGFTCYRNVPCHQACFYHINLCVKKPFDLKYIISADYEHFLWCYYKGKAKCIYINETIANYEGGGFSESATNKKRSKAEFKEITKKYIKPFDLFRYKMIMALSLAPLRIYISENKHLSKTYNAIKNFIYKKQINRISK